MSNQLTPFEQHIKSHYQGVDLSIFYYHHWICQLTVMETTYNAEFNLLIDEVKSQQDEEFLSEYFKSRVCNKRVFDSRSDQLLVNAYKELVTETLNNIEDRGLSGTDPRELRFYRQKDGVDGSYQAKQARELRLSQ